jgi:hypothetical protein
VLRADRETIVVGKPMIRDAIVPLRMIFWGGLIYLIDISYSYTRNGMGFRFDFVNDVVGTLLITAGVFRLGVLEVDERYNRVMTFVAMVATLSVLDAVRAHFVMPIPPLVRLFLQLYGMVTLAAIIAFCVAMRWLSTTAQLARSAASWRTTTMLFVGCYAFPLGLGYLADIAATATGRPLKINLGPLALLLVPIFVVPIIHLFISTTRMQREAEM